MAETGEIRLALVCIAKNEDNYIDEWLDYHRRLGFDRVFVYQNNWRYAGDKTKYDYVEWIEFDGDCMQLAAYNDFILNRSDGYTFGAFFDVDEFLCSKSVRALKDVLADYSEFGGIAVNWRFFGDNGLKEPDGDYSVLRRFTKSAKDLNRHVKTIVNFGKTGKKCLFVNPHCVLQSMLSNIVINANITRFVAGPFNENERESLLELNHYQSKTEAEFRLKFDRGRADVSENSPNYRISMENWSGDNNDICNRTALDFYERAK